MPYAIAATVPDMPIPASVNPSDQAQYEAWYEEWNQSDEGRAYRAAQRSFAVAIEPDGSFRAREVPPGAYTIAWTIMTRSGERIGNLSHAFAVPDGVGTFDLGALEISAPKTMKVGDEAPLFEAKSLDGVPVKLADFRGKYVLLDFWATWCGPCIGETPYLVDTFKQFGGDERFAMIGLSLDGGVKEPIDYTTKNEMNWTQVFLGDWSASSVPEEYGVEGIPTIMLLVPDGKIVETNLRGPDIPAAVAKYLD
jgi:thiol-disulfide isomerase/thioredoxin